MTDLVVSDFIEEFDEEKVGQREPEVVSIEQVQRWGYSTLLIFVGIFLSGFNINLFSNVLSILYTKILGELESFDLNGLPEVFSNLLIIIALPLYGKFSDIYGRSNALLIALFLGVVGSLVVTAGNTNFYSFTVGNIVQAVGGYGYELLIPVILAELLVVKNRGLGFIMFWLPAVAAMLLALPLIEPIMITGWWYLYIISAGGAIVATLFLLFGLRCENRGKERLYNARKFGLSILKEIDFVGLLLLVSGLGLILLPFTIVVREPLGFGSPTLISMLCVGFFVFVGFLIWEFKFCSNPLIPQRLFQNKNLMLVVLVHSLLRFESTINWAYLTSYFIIARDISETHAALLNRTYMITFFLGGSLSALLLSKFKLTHSLAWFGCVVHTVGIGLTLLARHPNSPDILIILTESFMGLGTGMVVCICTVMYQSLVCKQDLATISYIFQLLDRVVAGVGSAIATATWNKTLADNLTQQLPESYAGKVPELLRDIYLLRSLPAELKPNWLLALGHTQLVMSSLSLTLACICMLLSFLLKPIKV